MSKPFTPTAEQRANVEAMAGCGIPHEELCLLVRQTSGKAIDAKTLRKHFEIESASGAVKVKALVGNFIISTILGREGGVKDERARCRLAEFFAKTRMGWKETLLSEITGKNGGPIIWQAYPEDEKL